MTEQEEHLLHLGMSALTELVRLKDLQKVDFIAYMRSEQKKNMAWRNAFYVDEQWKKLQQLNKD